MDFTPQINLLKGFCTLNFGVSAVDAELVFGKPEEIQVLDDNILETSCTVYHYWDSGFSLFFDNKNCDEVWQCRSRQRRDVVVWKEIIFIKRTTIN
jgi:hypothetical protein